MPVPARRLTSAASAGVVHGAVTKRRDQRNPEAGEIEGRSRCLHAKSFEQGNDRWMNHRPMRAQARAACLVKLAGSVAHLTTEPQLRSDELWFFGSFADHDRAHLLRSKEAALAAGTWAWRESKRMRARCHNRRMSQPRVFIQTQDFDLQAEVAALRGSDARRGRGVQLHRHGARPQRRQRGRLDGAGALPRHDREGDRGHDRRGASALRHPAARASSTASACCSPATRS